MARVQPQGWFEGCLESSSGSEPAGSVLGGTRCVRAAGSGGSRALGLPRPCPASIASPALPAQHQLHNLSSPAGTASSPASVPVRRDTAASSGLSLSVPRLSAAPAHDSWHRQRCERGPAARPALPFPPWQGGCVGIRAHPLPGHQPQPPVIPEVWC